MELSGSDCGVSVLLLGYVQYIYIPSLVFFMVTDVLQRWGKGIVFHTSLSLDLGEGIKYF